MKLPYVLFSFFFFFFFFSPFLGPHLWPMEIVRLGGNQSCSCWPQLQQHQRWATSVDIHCSMQKQWILNPMNKARDGTRILMDVSPVTHLATKGNPEITILFSSASLYPFTYKFFLSLQDKFFFYYFTINLDSFCFVKTAFLLDFHIHSHRVVLSDLCHFYLICFMFVVIYSSHSEYWISLF